MEPFADWGRIDSAGIVGVMHAYRLGPGHSALRRGRVSTPGRIYLVTFTTRDREPMFADHDAARACARAVTDPQLWPGSRLLAWVLMPDHWHGLLTLGDEDDLSHRIARVKTNSSRAVGATAAGGVGVWARSFHDRILRNGCEELFRAAHYVVMNPVRAGLVSHVGDYPYWDTVWLNRTAHVSHTVGAA